MTKRGASTDADPKPRPKAQGEPPPRPRVKRDTDPAGMPPAPGPAAPDALARPLVAVTEGTPDPLEPFNTRLPRSLQRRLKVHAALHGVKIQDVLSAALSEYLSARGS